MTVRSTLKILRHFTLAILAVIFIGTGVGVYLWKSGWIQTWAETRVTRLYFEKIRDELPFEIEEIELSRDWHELLKGRLSSLKLTILKDGWRIHLEGPVRFPPATSTTLFGWFGRKSGREALRIDYDAQAQIDPPSAKTNTPKGIHPATSSPEFPLHLWVAGTHDGKEMSGDTRIEEIGIEAQASHWSWPSQGLEFEKPKINLHWIQGQEAHAEIDAQTLQWKEQASLSGVHVDASLALQIQPFKAGTTVQAEWSAHAAELFVGKNYFSTKSSAPLSGETRIDFSTPGELKADLELGPKPARPLQLSITKTAERSGKTHFDLRTPGLKSLSLAALIKDFVRPVQGLPELPQIERGRIGFHISGELNPKAEPTYEGNLNLEDLAVRSPENQLAASGVNLSGPFSSARGFTGTLQAKKVGYRHIQGQLLPTRIEVTKEQGPDWNVRVAGAPSGAKVQTSQIPLELNGIPLRIAALQGKITQKEGEPRTYDLRTSVTMDPTELSTISIASCIAEKKQFPPSKLSINVPELVIASNGIDAGTGKLHLDLFGGSIEATQISVETENSPEIDFDLSAQQLQLSDLGSFVGFGDMKGTLQASAKGVVLQRDPVTRSWLPTDYDASIELLPAHRGRIVFSPEAMNNSIHLLGGPQALEAVPGILQSFFFGWFSREILRGFDIDYAGAKLHSSDGFITIQTLDPHSVVRGTGKHFLIHGHRFKIALESSRYPAIVEANAAVSYGQFMASMLKDLARKKELEKELKDGTEPKTENDSDSEPSSCQPLGI